MKRFFFLTMVTFLTLSAHAQLSKGRADSLRSALKVSKPDTNRVRLRLSLVEWYQYNPYDRSPQNIDTALFHARQAETLSRALGYRKLVGETLLAKSEVLIDARASKTQQEQEARSALKEALQLFRAAGDQLHWADATFLNGMVYSTQDTTRLPYLQSALAIYKKLNNRERIAKTLDQIALTYFINGHSRIALRTYLDILAIQESTQDKEIGSTLDQLSKLYGDLGDYPKALHYAHRSYQIAKKSADLEALLGIYTTLAYIYDQLGDNRMALQYNQAVLEICRKTNRLQGVVRARLRICQILLVMGRNQEALNQAKAIRQLTETSVKSFSISAQLTLGNCYAALKDYQKAEAVYLKLLPDYKAATQGGFGLCKALGTLYLKTHQLNKAALYLNQAFRTIQHAGNQNHRRELILQLYRLDSIRGDHQSALAHHLMYTALNDSLINESKNKQIAQLRIRFDTDIKEQEIKALQRQRNLQQVSIDQNRIIRNIIVGGLVMLAVLLWLMYNRYRLKQLSNQQLEAKQVEIAHKNESLQNLVTEKEWLIREIHHRVKNNLQIIASLLRSQGVYLKDQAAVSAIRESQNRVHAMALIHQKLYQTDQLASIPMAEYVAEIVDYLISSFDHTGIVREHISVLPIELDVSLAVPLGLIINEAVTNSLKYAFPDGQSGTISIELIRLDSLTFRLTISDNGIGLPADFNPNKSRTMGLDLIRGLSKQLGGNLQINSTSGVQISLEFTEAKITERPLVDA
jgi:two-component sensor histidine kinase